MASSKINVTDLDFAQIKSNLKTFLKAQSEFQDYNFEGSGLSVLFLKTKTGLPKDGASS